MSYTLELPPDLDAQLHAVASSLQQTEADILLAAVRQYVSRLAVNQERWVANIQNPDSEAWLDATEQEGWVIQSKDPIAEEWLDYGEEMLRELP